MNGKKWIFFSLSGCCKVTPRVNDVLTEVRAKDEESPGFAMSTMTRALTARIFSSMGLTTNFLGGGIPVSAHE